MVNSKKNLMEKFHFTMNINLGRIAATPAYNSPENSSKKYKFKNLFCCVSAISLFTYSFFFILISFLWKTALPTQQS